MAFLFNEHFRSTARITYLNQFWLGQIVFNDSLSDWSSYTYHRGREYYPKFPVILQSDGLPWDIANAYLVRLAELKNPWEIESINTRAKGLLAYLRFLEDEKLDFLHLPTNHRLKAPYRFRSKLNELIHKGLSISYASNCIRAVIDFYKNIVRWELISQDSFSNVPYQKIEVFINYMNNYGFSRIKKVETSDISIKTPKSQLPCDHIRDGGSLRPLSVIEQQKLKVIVDSPNSNTALSLMIKISVTTGGRLQTICTLRNYHIDYLYEQLQSNQCSDRKNRSVELSTGMFRDIDTKNGVIQTLHFHPQLIEELAVYSLSEQHRKRMAHSYYGESRNNYLFLTRDGHPFYTSRHEMLARQAQESDQTNVIQRFPIKTGGAVETLFKRLVLELQKNHPEVNYFRFHDLRATFGMNLVRSLSAAGLSGLMLLMTVRDRMGHSDIAVTQRYLDFDEVLHDMNAITDTYEHHLFGGA
jgi:integrase